MLLDADPDDYRQVTQPHNSSTPQRPARVATITRPGDIAVALEEMADLARSRRRPLTAVPQATGHGAGAVAGAPTRRGGAVVAPPGDFIFHAVGALGRATRAQIDAGFERARAVWEAADTGAVPGSWMEGAASVPAALPDDVRRRARAVADAVDPEHRIRRSRLLG